MAIGRRIVPITQARLERWGRDAEPLWIHADEVTAPAAGTSLVSKTVSSGKIGYIYGFFVSIGEANVIKINWTSDNTDYSIRLLFGSAGSQQYIDFSPLNEGSGAKGGTDITITNVNAGGAGIIYQARLFFMEV